MPIERALSQFVRSTTPAAIVLQGKWGLGKTYFWRKRIMEPYLAKPWRKKYSYVSLFGLASLSDLKVAIYQATKEFDYDLRNKWWRFIHPKWLWWKAQPILPTVLNSAAIPYVRNGLAPSYDALSFYFVKNRLICFDDIERRNSGLALLDFLGLVSQLVEQRNCRVVVILNTGALSVPDQAVWDDNKEKVFQGEMTYAPSLTESIDLGLLESRNEPWHRYVQDSLRDLKVSNIRIVQRTRKFVSEAIASVDAPLRDETVRQIARVVPLLVFSHSGRAEKAPPLDYVMKSGPFDFAIHSMSDKNQEKSDEEKGWMEMLSNYHVFLGSELDNALFRMVSAGYPDSQEIRAAVADFEANAQEQANKDLMHRAWRLYHDTLEENADAFADALEEAWPRVSETDHAHNLESMVRLLRMVERPEVATRFINEWVAQRAGTRIEELSVDVTQMFGPLRDPELLHAIDTAYHADHPEIPIVQALEMMTSNQGIQDEAIAAIASTTPENLAAVLTENPRSGLSASIKNTLQLGDYPQNENWALARANMRSACEIIARRSPLSADRMSNKFGIKIVD